MRCCRLSLIAFSTSLFLNTPTFAAAFQFYELGTPIIGTADVGQAAVASDASTAYFNPAGMSQLKSTQYMLASQMITPKTNFSPSTRTTISGNNGGSAGLLIPGLGGYYVYRYSPKVQLGLSLTSPYGGLLTYNDGWVGRFIVQNLQLITLNLNPSIAYKINNWVTIAVGVAAEYAKLQQTVALPLTHLIDGQANVKVDNFAPGFNAGILITPTDQTKIGVAYRSRITHNFSGDTTFLRIDREPKTTTKMVLPHNVIMSLSQNLTSKFAVLGELGWAGWSSMQDTTVRIAGFSATTRLDWHNTWRAGLGSQYKLTPHLLVQAGASYDSSPTNASHRVPDLPMDRQIRVGTGMILDVLQVAKLGFSYEYINFGNANIDNISSNGLLAGSYSRNNAHVLQASINVSC